MMFSALIFAAVTGLASPAGPDVALFTSASVVRPPRLVSPVLRVPEGPALAPHVALTFDACTGLADERILTALITNKIKATVFVTARWLKRNPQALAELKAHPELFDIENHGAKHLAAVDVPTTVFAVRAAGSAAAVRQEVLDGAAAVKAATGRDPTWYRGATALYSQSALSQIEGMHVKIAGYSLSGDGGAQYSSKRTAAVIGGAQNGDVIIAHINQPSRAAGAGVVQGLLALKAKGFVFVRLDEGRSEQVTPPR